MPTPEQIQAAMPAMRDYVALGVDARPPRIAPPLTNAYVLWRIGSSYPGGVAQFIEDQEGRRG